LRRRVAALQGEQCEIDLMVITHIDADHIDGTLILLQELKPLNVQIDELWFNGWAQLPQKQGSRAAFAPIQGEFLTGLITVDPALEQVWNRTFDQKSVVVPDEGPLPEIELEGDARLILLGPSTADLRRLRRRWSSAIRDFSPGDTEEALRRLRERRRYRAPATPAVFAAPQYGNDRSPANGSSISFVFEQGNVSILFAGDARTRTLANSLQRLAGQRSKTRLHFDAVKLPHHGSMRNVNDAWLQWVDCEQWLFSTNGDVFDHPDVATAQLIARHCPHPPTMLCNYHSPSTERLEQNAELGPWNTAFPESETTGPVGGLKLSW
jgi:hypothetical protein